MEDSGFTNKTWFISAFGVATSSVHNFLSCHYSAIVSSVEWCLALPHPVCLALARVLSAETQEKSFLKNQTFLKVFFSDLLYDISVPEASFI